mmetsp:Transcript_18954/g.37920  ORF Transcript_18954/g.37920 Transcript_18954/m.37920 type:complete len:339 (-) Transcript_18954:17-1033(-)
MQFSSSLRRPQLRSGGGGNEFGAERNTRASARSAVKPTSLSRLNFATVIFLLVAFFFLASERLGVHLAFHGGAGGGSEPEEIFDFEGKASKAADLVIVTGHAVLNFRSSLDRAGFDDDCWYLLPYQIQRGMPQAIEAHIRAGVAEAAKNVDALLVFSGGETRRDVGPVSEGASYFAVADALSLWGSSSNTVRARTVTEEFATDSYENVLFSICRFHEITGAYPRHITVVSFSFKQRRFEDMHAYALRWPSERLSYVGVDPPPKTGFDLAFQTKGELENAASLFESDLYGCHSERLVKKRESRNPYSRTPSYERTCGHEMKELIKYCGPSLFQGNLPWD